MKDNGEVSNEVKFSGKKGLVFKDQTFFCLSLFLLFASFVFGSLYSTLYASLPIFRFPLLIY